MVLRMRTLLGLAVILACAACGSDAPQRNTGTTPASLPLPQFAPGSYVVAITVDGQEADLGKSQRCQEVLERNGVMVRPDAGVMAQLTLNEGRNFLRVFRRLSIADFQLLRQVPKPDWSMNELCRDMVREIVAALSQPAPPVAPPLVQGGATTELPPPPGSMPPSAFGPPPGSVSPPVAAVELDLLPPSAALPPNSAALVAAAEQAYRAGDFGRAHASYAEAHRQSGDAFLLFDIGLCFFRLGSNAEGLKFLQLYLDRAQNPPNRAATEQKIGELRRLLGDED